MQVVPFGPSPAGQNKVPQAVFGPDKGTDFKKVAAVKGPKTIDLAPAVAFNDLAFANFGQQFFYLKSRIQWTDGYAAIGKFAGQIVRGTGFVRCLIHWGLP
jgi:hypothetical protein